MSRFRVIAAYPLSFLFWWVIGVIFKPSSEIYRGLLLFVPYLVIAVPVVRYLSARSLLGLRNFALVPGIIGATLGLLIPALLVKATSNGMGGILGAVVGCAFGCVFWLFAYWKASATSETGAARQSIAEGVPQIASVVSEKLGYFWFCAVVVIVLLMVLNGAGT